MIRYLCKGCLNIFDNPKVKYEKIPFIHGFNTCPSCNCIDLAKIAIKELNIIVFDDVVDCRTAKPCKYDVTFSSSTNVHIKKVGTGYVMMFHISDFNQMDMFDLGRYIMQFIIDTSHPKERFVFKFVNNMADRSEMNDESGRLCEQLMCLVHTISRISKRIVVVDGWTDIEGIKTPHLRLVF